MSEKIWKNRWICNPKYRDLEPLQLLHRQLDPEFRLPEHREELKNNHTLFRKKIQIEHLTDRVILDISADDYYKLYINGKYVTQGPASSYFFCYNYNRIDITDHIIEGENIIAVHVYYQGLVNRAYNSGDYRQGMIAEIHMAGEQLADDCWRYKEAEEYGASRTIAYDTQFDELIDNNKKIIGWKERDFDDSSWEKAAIKENDDHILMMQQTKNLQMEYRTPVEVKRVEGGWLLDFGKDLTGTFYMKAWGKRGDRVRIIYGEELQQNGLVRNDMRCNCLYEDSLVLAEGENELEQFEYKCFRYVQLTTDDPVQMDGFRVDYRHYPFDDGYAEFYSGDELIDGIWKICKNAVKNCAQEAFLDCPHREKGQYLGDLTVTAHAFHYLTGDDALFRKALTDFAHSTEICSGMMAVAPGSFMQEIADFSLLYPYQLLLYYHFTEDREFLEQLLPVAEGVERYFDRFKNKEGLVENVKTKWNLVDWPENLRDGYDFDLSQPVVGDGCHNVINALYIGMKKCLNRIREILDIPGRSETEKLIEAYIKVFYDEERGLFTDAYGSRHCSLHANVFPAFYGVLPKGNRISELIRDKGLSCGVFVSYFVLYALIRMGEKGLAYDLIVNTTEHSWYNMLKEGAETSFEAWGKDQKWNTSLCHAWAAAPIPVLKEYFD